MKSLVLELYRKERVRVVKNILNGAGTERQPKPGDLESDLHAWSN